MQQAGISVADLHGNKVQYRKLLEYVVKQNIKYVFLAGDLLPKDGGSWSPDNKIRTIKMQADFINDFFLDYLKELGKYAKAYAIFGNDDFISRQSGTAHKDETNHGEGNSAKHGTS